LFILEGLPAIVLGVVTIFFLTDHPHQANWLPASERDWLTAQLDHEQQVKSEHHSLSIWQAFRHREVILLTLSFFCIVTTAYGFTFWLPTIVKRASQSSNVGVGLLSAVPYTAGLGAILIAGWSSDRTGERRWHTAISMVLASIGLLFGVLTQNHIGI